MVYEDYDVHNSPFVFMMADEVEECSIKDDLMSNNLFMSALKKVLLVVFCLSACCVGISCSYLQLRRRFDTMENRRQAHIKWMQLYNDPEKGQRLKQMFAKKMT